MINETKPSKILQIDLYLHSFLQDLFCILNKNNNNFKKYDNCQTILK